MLFVILFSITAFLLLISFGFNVCYYRLLKAISVAILGNFTDLFGVID